MTKPKGTSFKTYLMIIFAVFIIYNAVGVYYNQKRHRLYGLNAVPHIDKWRKLPDTLKFLVLEGINKAIVVLALARGYLKSKLQNY